jgi:hypothetical protein
MSNGGGVGVEGKAMAVLQINAGRERRLSLRLIVQILFLMVVVVALEALALVALGHRRAIHGYINPSVLTVAPAKPGSPTLNGALGVLEPLTK